MTSYNDRRGQTLSTRPPCDVTCMCGMHVLRLGEPPADPVAPNMHLFGTMGRTKHAGRQRAVLSCAVQRCDTLWVCGYDRGITRGQHPGMSLRA